MAALRKQHNFDTICLMPTNLYGKGDNYHIMNSHVCAALIRSFMKLLRTTRHQLNVGVLATKEENL